MTDYCTVDELKAELGETTARSDTPLGRVITSASRMIDNLCGFPRRQFFAGAPNEVRYYTPQEAREVRLDDITTVASVQADIDGDGTFENTWTVNSDYLLAPYNAAGQGWPYTSLEIPTFAVTIMPVVRRGLKVTGTFGWPAVPADVKEACLKQAARLFKRREAVFGIAPVPSIDGGGIPLRARFDPDALALLEAYVLNPITVG